MEDYKDIDLKIKNNFLSITTNSSSNDMGNTGGTTFENTGGTAISNTTFDSTPCMDLVNDIHDNSTPCIFNSTPCTISTVTAADQQQSTTSNSNSGSGCTRKKTPSPTQSIKGLLP